MGHSPQLATGFVFKTVDGLVLNFYVKTYKIMASRSNHIVYKIILHIRHEKCFVECFKIEAIKTFEIKEN